jgi:SagB-type dehydrogenase family enzyme
MDKLSLPGSLPAIHRRDFLKFLSLTGGAVLLAGCAGDKLTATQVLQADSPLPPSSTPEVEASDATTATFTPSPTETPSQTPEPPLEYLPAADGSYTSYPLPEPQFPSYMPLAQALQERHSSRTFRTDELPVPAIAAVLWAGFGVNRPDGKRTAPSANNVQDIEIYLATAKGLFHYEAAGHRLTALMPDDLRPFTGSQDFVASAPVNLIYVSDFSRMDASDETRLQWSWAHSGCIAQNVYLACAALGLSTVVRSTLNHAELNMRMGLQENQHITLAQTLGYRAD